MNKEQAENSDMTMRKAIDVSTPNETGRPYEDAVASQAKFVFDSYKNNPNLQLPSGAGYSEGAECVANLGYELIIDPDTKQVNCGSGSIEHKLRDAVHLYVTGRRRKSKTENQFPEGIDYHDIGLTGINPEPEIAERLDRESTIARIIAYFERHCNEREAEVMLAYFLRQLSSEDAGEILGMSGQTFRQHANRLVRPLRAELASII